MSTFVHINCASSHSLRNKHLRWYSYTVNLSLFQRPSRYINNEVNAVHKDAPVKVALAFPDVYEIGMSHLGLRILYKIINELPFAFAERVFSPWIDLEAEMKSKGLPLCSLESNRILKHFDIVGFSLQYELSYTTVLNMLHLGGIPIKAEDRADSPYYPIILAGGPCTVNPMPMSPFIDAFLLGDGEEAIVEILDTYHKWKREGDRKKESLLRALSEIAGIYVPSVHISISGEQAANNPPSFVKRRFIRSLDDAPYPVSPIVPYTSIIHDRINIEVSRGCSRGCRFCQAGIIYRPARERSPDKALHLAKESLRNTGYEEVAFTSLSAGDYSCLLQVVKDFNREFERNKIALSLPSLRVTAITSDLLKEVRMVRKTGFTIAPEAGTERLRKAINKDFSEQDYEQVLKILFGEGWLNLKLYFMIGLPTETHEDIEGILGMSMKALRIAKRHTKRFVNINVGISPFVPKAHTPFQWHPQAALEELKRRKMHIKDMLMKKGFNVKGHDVRMSLLEAAFSRGDTNLSALIEKAWSLGCRLDGWSEVFEYEKWKTAMDLIGIDAAVFAMKTYGFSDALPWDIIDTGVSKEFLWKENQKALSGDISADCRKVCHNCGLGCLEEHQKTEACEDETMKIESIKEMSHFLNSSSSPSRRFKPVRIRVEFSKTGRLRYLSHLELAVLLQRAMRRAGFPLEFSQGYHPSPKISFGPPLGVGIAGLSEYFDIEVTPPFDLDTNRKKLNGLVPEGISIKDMSAISAGEVSLSNFISRYEYEINARDFSYVQRFLSEKERFVIREKGKVNIREMVQEARVMDEKTICLLLADQGELKVRLGELIPLMFNLPLEELDITRTALYGWKDGWVKPLEGCLQWTAKY